MFQLEVRGKAKKLRVLGITTRVPSLDPRYTQHVKRLYHREFVAY